MFSPVPIQASSIRTASPFRVCIQDAIGLPAVSTFKNNTYFHPTFASFFTISEFFLKIRISIHFAPPAWETSNYS